MREDNQSNQLFFKKIHVVEKKMDINDYHEYYRAYVSYLVVKKTIKFRPESNKKCHIKLKTN